MSGFSISRLSHRLAIQDRPPREKSQSALNKKDQDETEQSDNTLSNSEFIENKEAQRRLPTNERIDLCNVRNALFDIDYVLVYLSYVRLSYEIAEEKILSFSALSGKGLENCLMELEQELFSLTYDGKVIFKGEISECVIHVEQLDIDESDVVLSMKPFAISWEELKLKDASGNWSVHLQEPSKLAILLYASKIIQEKLSIVQTYFEKMQSLISKIIFIHKNINYEHLDVEEMKKLLTELHHDLRWDDLLDELFENTDLDGIKEISMQYL